MKRYDLAVVGGGTAGMVAALVAAAAGARVALIERERTGGDCLWTGCVPSKSLIAAADLAQRIREGERLGVRATPEVDFAAVMAHVDASRETIATEDSPERLRGEGIDVIEAQARYLGPGRLEAAGRELAYRATIIATGSTPALPPVRGIEDADPLTSENLWELRELPPRLAVLGGGPVGCELGQAFARLGSEVTLVEAEARVLGKEEPRASAVVEERMRADGVRMLTSTAASEVVPGTAGSGKLLTAGGEGPVEFDRLLVATGRRPVTDGLGLGAIGVRTAESGAVAVDRRLRAGPAGVYAAGDVTGELPFTHVAAHHAGTAAVNALFRARRKISYRAVPWATFTDPEVARVGLSEEQARERWGDRTRIATYEYAKLDRAITAGRDEGFVKLVGDRRGRLVGATVAAPAAGESIAELTAWIEQGQRLDKVGTTVHAYPTFSEGAVRASLEYVQERYATPLTRALTRPVLALLRVLDRPE